MEKSKSKLKLTLAKLILEQLSPSLWIRNKSRFWNGRVNWQIMESYGLIRMPRQSLLRGLSRWRYLKDVSDSCGKLDLAFTTKMSSRTAITILGYQRLVCFITFSHCAAFRTSPRASSRTSPRTSYRASSWTAFCLWRKWIIIVNTGIHNWY